MHCVCLVETLCTTSYFERGFPLSRICNPALLNISICNAIFVFFVVQFSIPNFQFLLYLRHDNKTHKV